MPFLYLRDPLFLCCFSLYWLNRLAEHYGFGTRLTESYLNDVICVPFLLPMLLWGQRQLRLRHHDRPPTYVEVVIPMLIWAYLFEVYLPGTERWRGLAIADPVDVFCYAIGGLASWVYWQRSYRARKILTDLEPAAEKVGE